MANYSCQDFTPEAVDSRMEYKALRVMESCHWEHIQYLWKGRPSDIKAMDSIVESQKKINNLLGKLQSSLKKAYESSFPLQEDTIHHQPTSTTDLEQSAVEQSSS